MFHRRGKGFEKQVIPGETYVGELIAGGDVRIDGTVRGRVATPGKLVIGPGGRVDATVNAGEIVVAGELSGRVEATRRLHVLDGGRLYADAAAGMVVIEEGAECRGSVRLRSRRPDGRTEEVVCILPARRGGGAPTERVAEANPRQGED